MENVNDTFFDGYYKDIWRNMIPEQLTVKEVEFMINHFKLQPGDGVLDLMCGYGRHAIALAKKGLHVTAIDNLTDYVLMLEKEAELAQVSLKVINTNILDYRADVEFDLVICMGNSLNFFDESDIRVVLTRLNKNLRTGGHLLIHSWSIEEIAARTFKSFSEGMIGQIKMETTSRYLFNPTRIEAETKMTTSAGESEVKKGVDYIYSISEYERLLKESGFQIQQLYSIPGIKEFSVGEPRIYIVAKKDN